ncbi:MAG: hypothetical protein HFE64_03470 [Lachnospiraceae bacterium]|jgi:hypothetical protein|nr:hypothetical protein [Lachnospiraceae bacterium]
MNTQNEWKKKNMTQIAIRLHNKNDKEIIDHIKSQKNIADYIRNLVAEDIEKNIKKDENNC